MPDLNAAGISASIPSFFGADGLATILAAIRRSFDVDYNAEITFEANPDSVSDGFPCLSPKGVPRISFS